MAQQQAFTPLLQLPAEPIGGSSSALELTTTVLDQQGFQVSKDTISAAENSAMREAVDRAFAAMKQSGKAGIAATILLDGASVGWGENEVSLQSDPTKHAEMVALTAAAKQLGTTDLSQCVMISTLQPCEMCLAAMRFSGIKRVIFGATQEKVAAKYFVFPMLSLADFQNAGEAFEAIGGQCEDELLPLYVGGHE